LKNPVLLDKVTWELKQVADLDNILTRLALWRANPRDLIALKTSMQVILKVYEIIKENWDEKLTNLLKIK
jgi:DNA mismatch repair ATPase MutS